MRYLFLLILCASTTAFAQSYSEKIAQHREKYKADFLVEKGAPLKEADLKYLNFFDTDSNYQVVAKVKVLKNEQAFNMPTYDGTTKEFIRHAQISFVLKERKFKMVLYRSLALMANPLYKDLLFLPFSDETNGTFTYGGGRYIDLNINDIKSKKITIDFNKAYNPYCAYSDGYRCPVPPQENRLYTSILAGEKMYTGEKKHK